MLSVRPLVRRLSMSLLALFTTIPFVNAGTYSVVDVEWYPAGSPGVGTFGGFINFSGNDVQYGLNGTCDAPYWTPNGMGPPQGHGSNNLVPTTMGTFRWKVQWVGAPGETPPGTVNGNAEYKGAGSCTASAEDFSASVAATATVSVSDVFFSCHNGATSGLPGVVVNPGTANSPNNGAQNLAVGATFTYVTGTVNTYVGYFTDSVNSGANLNATASFLFEAPQSVSGCGASLSVTIRLTTVDGQQVQPNL
jgi:hypothetical protein